MAPCLYADATLNRIKTVVPKPRFRIFLPTSSSRSANHSSPMYILPILRLKGVVEQIVPDASLETVLEIPSTHLTRLYTLNISGSKQLLLSLQPPLAVRLLRHEQSLLLCEAKLLQFLSKASTSTTVVSPSGEDDTSRRILNQLIPKMLKHSSNTKELGYPYTIFEPIPGSPLSSQSIYLTAPERRHIDIQIGTLVRDLASTTSPSGNFGPVLRVCRDQFTKTANVEVGDGGSETWSLAFGALVESILRDGEDMSVLLPYEVIRRQFSRLSWRLKAVTTPRLTLPDAGSETVVLVERKLEGDILLPEDSVRLTGLRHWSRGVFGDPLMSSCFENPSEAFLAGWKGDSDESLIEDLEGTNTRLLLYRCYRAIVDVVMEYYRPRNESSRLEMDARKRLTAALAELEIADLEGSHTPKRARANSIVGADMTVVKRLKTESEEE